VLCCERRPDNHALLRSSHGAEDNGADAGRTALEHVRVESSTWSSCVCIVRTSWPSSIHSYGFARVLLSRAAAHAAAKEDEP